MKAFVYSSATNSKIQVENLSTYFFVFSQANFYYLTDVKQYEISCTQVI